jgi:glycosyltransferase involved in cell wall biosynthesis
MSAREAFVLGRTLVVPSRAESLPYVVLEAAGACIPIVATNVGGIPEIFGPLRQRLITADSVIDLADALIRSWTTGSEQKQAEALELAAYVHGRFSVSRMVDSVLAAYREALVEKHSAPRLRAGTSVALSS